MICCDRYKHAILTRTTSEQSESASWCSIIAPAHLAAELVDEADQTPAEEGRDLISVEL